MLKFRFLGLVLVVALCLAGAQAVSARSLTGSRGIPVVNDPKDLSLVDLKPLSNFLYSDLKKKGSFGLIRRKALEYKADKAGIPNPRKKAFHAGCVIEKSSVGNSAILVLAGDLEFKNVRAAIEKDYREYMSRNRGTPNITEDEMNGLPVVKFGYADRPYEVCVLQIPDRKVIVVGSVPKSDYGLLESTLDVVCGKEKLNEQLVDSAKAESTVTLSPQEIERLVIFNRPRGKLRKTFAAGMKSMAKKLGIPHSEDEAVPLEERIRGQLALSTDVTAQYKWDCDANKQAAYEISYRIQAKSEEAAQALKGLISEQITRLAEKSPWEGESESLGRLTVQGDGNTVRLNFLLDTPEAQYQHMSLLLGQMFQYKSATSFLDRFGSAE